MSKRQVKSQASSSRAAFSTAATGFGASSSFGFATSSSQLSYVTEPPDLSAISDPNVVVYFRNLQKKDSTTKAKALEDLQTYISSLKESIEEPVLEAWVCPASIMYRSVNGNVAFSCRLKHFLVSQLIILAGCVNFASCFMAKYLLLPESD
jgi:hypothetical protein